MSPRVSAVVWGKPGVEGLSPGSISKLCHVGLGVVVALGRWLPSVLDLVSGRSSTAGSFWPTALFPFGRLDLALVVPPVTVAIGFRAAMPRGADR